ncbi:hypothetical protein QJQ45_010118 [Haematococcus lacustris]|nr:hypothetical protein QJQ45_010118 [Haematococcus lacustris]
MRKTAELLFSLQTLFAATWPAFWRTTGPSNGSQQPPSSSQGLGSSSQQQARRAHAQSWWGWANTAPSTRLPPNPPLLLDGAGWSPTVHWHPPQPPRLPSMAREARWLWSFAAPCVVAAGAEYVAIIISTIMAWRLGPESMAAVGLGSLAWTVVTLALDGCCTALEALGAHAIGNHDKAGLVWALLMFKHLQVQGCVWLPARAVIGATLLHWAASLMLTEAPGALSRIFLAVSMASCVAVFETEQVGGRDWHGGLKWGCPSTRMKAVQRWQRARRWCVLSHFMRYGSLGAANAMLQGGGALLVMACLVNTVGWDQAATHPWAFLLAAFALLCLPSAMALTTSCRVANLLGCGAAARARRCTWLMAVSGSCLAAAAGAVMCLWPGPVGVVFTDDIAVAATITSAAPVLAAIMVGGGMLVGGVLWRMDWQRQVPEARLMQAVHRGPEHTQSLIQHALEEDAAADEQVAAALLEEAQYDPRPLHIIYQACRKVVERANSGKPTDRVKGKLVTVDDIRTSRVSSAMNSPQPCEEELDRSKPTRTEGWKPQPGQVQHRLLRSAWSKRFEGSVQGLMWCPWLHQATPGDVGKWVDRDCNAALNLQRAGESKWRPLELCRWQHRGAAPAKGKEYPALGVKKLRDRAPRPKPSSL